MTTASRSRRAAWWLLPAALLIGGLIYMIKIPGRSFTGPLLPLAPEEIALRDRLKTHIQTLAGEIGERNLWRYPALEASARYIEKTLREMSYRVAMQEFEVDGKTGRNIEVERAGTSLPGEIVVIGAHYDSVLGSPGANDNATGVAAALEIARLLAGQQPARTVRLVAFVNEEPPFFHTERMGSRIYARRARARGDRIVAMLSLETLGYYSDNPGSQHYPLLLFRLFYPGTGNFLAFVGNLSSRELVRSAIGSFRRNAPFPSEGVAAPGWIPGIDWSDQWSFWKEGYPAIMVTDTALFRYPHYHSATDTPDKVDHDRLARVVTGLTRVTLDLAGGATAR